MLIWAMDVIGAAFAVFVVGVLVTRLIRADRALYELRQRRAAENAGPEEGPRKPSDDFHDQIWLPMCQRVADLAAQRMQRAVEEEERRTIWRSRSPLVLEILLKELAAASPGEAMALLKNAPTGLDRPDPTGWCEQQN